MTIFKQKILMIFVSKFSLDINKLVCRLSESKQSFFPLVPLIYMLSGSKFKHFLNDAFQSFYDLFQVNYKLSDIYIVIIIA